MTLTQPRRGLHLSYEPIGRSYRSIGAALLQAPARGALFFAPLAVVVALWQVLSSAEILNPRTVPSPVAVFQATVDLLSDGEIFRHLLATVYRAEAGLLSGFVVGCALGLGMARMPRVRQLFYPIVALTYTLPKTALIPIVFLWLGVGDASSIFVVFVGALVPIVITTYQGATAVPDILVWSARSLGTPSTHVLWRVVLPAAMPQIMNGLRIAHAFSIVIVISAEMVASYVGVGRFIFVYGEAGNYDYMFAAISIIVLTAFLLDRLFLALRNWSLRWTDRGGANR